MFGDILLPNVTLERSDGYFLSTRLISEMRNGRRNTWIAAIEIRTSRAGGYIGRPGMASTRLSASSHGFANRSPSPARRLRYQGILSLDAGADRLGSSLGSPPAGQARSPQPPRALRHGGLCRSGRFASCPGGVWLLSDRPTRQERTFSPISRERIWLKPLRD